ncbi:uncharacterized protein LOC134078707 [Sardina pilchardus]|uniref:uncharacterized protein LOC134078707 n=1 Tax=Sardina pilchardus TaxID=27697 RepID=UPI002E1048FA
MVSKRIVVGILCLLGHALARPVKERKVFGAKGASIALASEQLPEGTKVKSIRWTHNGHIAADWEKGDERPSYYGNFNSTTTLDMNTWALTISNLLAYFTGKYSSEVNDKDPTRSVNVAVIDAVPLYGEKGQPITLEPEVPNVHVKVAEWELNNMIIARCDGGVSQTLYSTLLDCETFRLIIPDLLKNHSGLYIFKIDDARTDKAYLLTVRDELALRIAQKCNSTSCTLNCTGANNENIDVTWTDNKGREESGPVWVVERSEDLDVTYTCSSDSGSWMNNSISERELFPGYSVTEDAKRKMILGIMLGIFLLGVGVGVGVGVLWYKKSKGAVTRGLQQDGQPQQPNGIPLLQMNGQSQQNAQQSDDENPLNGGMGNHENV